VLLEANAQIGAEIVEQAAEIDPLIFAYLGEDLLGLPARTAAEATATAVVTWALDVETATVYPAGSLIAVPTSSGDSVAFQTNTDLPANPRRPVTGVGNGNLFTLANHGFTAGTAVIFTNVAGGGNIVNGTVYYVIALGLTASAFKVSVAAGGVEVDLTSDLTALVERTGGQSVTITALEPGEEANGAYGQAEPIDIVDGVEAVVVTEPSSGGTEDETSDEYLGRLAEALTILAPRPILPNDFSVMARQVPGVGRATAIDLYQPSTGQGGYGTPRGASPATSVPRCTTVVVTAEAGAAPSNALLQEVYDLLDAAREVNFLVYTIAPGYDVIDVQATVRRYPNTDAAAVEASAEAALAAWLDPVAWGQPPGALAGDWVFDNTVRLYEAVEALNKGAGVHYVESVQIRKTGGSFGTSDIALKTPVGLPTPGTLTVTVTSPA